MLEPSQRALLRKRPYYQYVWSKEFCTTIVRVTSTVVDPISSSYILLTSLDLHLVRVLSSLATVVVAIQPSQNLLTLQHRSEPHLFEPWSSHPAQSLATPHRPIHSPHRCPVMPLPNPRLLSPRTYHHCCSTDAYLGQEQPATIGMRKRSTRVHAYSHVHVQQLWHTYIEGLEFHNVKGGPCMLWIIGGTRNSQITSTPNKIGRMMACITCKESDKKI